MKLRVWIALSAVLSLAACSDPLDPDRSDASASANVAGAMQGAMSAGEVSIVSGSTAYQFGLKWQFYDTAGCTGGASTLRQFPAVTSSGITLRFDTWTSMQITASETSSLGDDFVRWSGTDGSSTTDLVTCIEYPAASLAYTAYYGTNTNTPPVLSPIGNHSVNEDELLAFTAGATDAETASAGLVFSLTGAPIGASITPGGAFTWTPTESNGPGQFPFIVCVHDDAVPAASDCEFIIVTVDEVNSAPVLGVISDIAVETGVQVQFIASASDSDQPANVLSYSLSGAPAGATLSATTGAFSWTPSTGGVYTFDVVVTDNGTPPLSDSQTVQVTVAAANPEIMEVSPSDNAVLPAMVPIDVTVRFKAPATGDEANCVAQAFNNAQAPVTGTTGSGVGTCVSTFVLEKAGIYDVVLTVRDRMGRSDTRSFRIIVYDEDGGSLTAGGWFTSAPGSLRDAPSATGKANFNITARYNGNKRTLTGNFKLQFQAAAFHFSATALDWLVVDPVTMRAELSGTGSVLGEPDVYGFRVFARSGVRKTDDTIRIVIWRGTNPADVVYDSGVAGSIEGGSISVHKGK